MTSPSAVRRIPFWLLTLGSLGVTGYGIWSATNRLTTMESVLTDGTATTADVYAGQSWVVVDAAFIAGGLIGLAITLAVWAVGTRFGTPAAAVTAADLAPLQLPVQEEPPFDLEPVADEHTVVATAAAPEADDTREAAVEAETVRDDVPAADADVVAEDAVVEDAKH